MNFKQTRELVEDIDRKKGGGKCRSSDLDMIASCVMAERDGMKIHSKVNDAGDKAAVSKIWNTKRYHLFSQAHFLRGIIRAKPLQHLSQNNVGPKDLTGRSFQDFLTELIVAELCDGDLLEKERQAFFNRESSSMQVRVIEAYRRAIHDDGGAPTLAEVRAELDQYEIASLPRGWKLRNMVTNTFGLPLSKGKRGRPRTK